MIPRYYLTLSLAYVALLTSGSAALGQLSSEWSTAVASHTAISAGGERIVSWPADPWMTAAAEQRIVGALQQEWTLPAISKLPLHQVVSMLRSSVEDLPLRIDERALEDTPFTASVEITFDRQGISVGAALSQILRPLGLTYQISLGTLMITTPEAAEISPVLRLYDITPLLQPNDDNWYPLGDLIQRTVSPDTWEIGGGTSVLEVARVGGRVLLIVSTTTEVHFQIDTLLNRMNQAGFSSASGARHYRQLDYRRPDVDRSGNGVRDSGRLPASHRRLPRFAGR